MSKRDDFLAAARSQVDKGIYVWGGDGQDILAMDDPEAWIRKHEKTKKDADRAIALLIKRRAACVDPIRAFDCSGLVYWCNKQAKVGYGDKTANGYWGECEPVSVLMPGDLVFHHNGIRCVHVGIYDGDGYVIESYGRDKGVIRTKRGGDYWNRQGRLKKLKVEYGLLGDANCDGKITAADAAIISRYLAHLSDLTEQGKINADVDLDGKITADDAQAILDYVVGAGTLPPKKTVHLTGNLCLRETGTKKGKLIGYARKGNDYPLLGIDPNTGWYMIQVKNKVGFISNATKYTQLR